MPFGYVGKILRANLTIGVLSEQSLKESVLRKYIGGSGLAARILFDETDVYTEALSPNNPLIFMTGPLTGTKVPLSGRYEVVSKSPLTGIYGESNGGGTWGPELKKAGYDGLVVSGASSRPVYLWINDGKPELRPAEHLWSLDTFEVDNAIKGETEKNAVVASIGPAGEKMARIASIMTDGKDGRAAGRCGLGAVMGFKKLKAVAVRGDRTIDVAHQETLAESVKEVASIIVKGTENFHNYGTSGGMVTIEYIGDLPIKNWFKGSWPDGAEKLSGQTMAKTILVGRYYCSGCIVGCGREIRFEHPRYGKVEGAGPEYETSAIFGANCLIDDLEAVAKANELCNRYGLDTLSTGGAVAFAIEAYEHGLIDEKDTGGIKLAWGDPNGMLSLVEKIGKRENIGSLLGEGVRLAAEKIGDIAPEFAIHVNGLELPAHDPRAYYSQGLSYATANRGACHLQSLSHAFERSATLPDLGYPEVQDPHGVEGKGDLVVKTQNLMSIFDSLVLCKFLVFGKITPTHLTKWTNLVTGWNMKLKDLMLTGERIYNLKRSYNVRLGISRKNDVLPSRILVHKRGEGGSPDNLPPLGELLSQYYALRGWNEMGIPKREKLVELGLETI